MARSYLTAINLNKNELQNAAVQNLGAAPVSPVKGQLYFNSTGGDNTLYWWDGTTWIPAKATGGAFPGYGSVPAETTFGITKNDGAATTVARSDHTHGSPTHDAAAHSTIPISALAAATGSINMGGFTIQGVGTPVNGTDAANKNYVDNAIAGLNWKDAVRVATGINFASLAGLVSVDSRTLVDGDRVLVNKQTLPQNNGIYIAHTGAWTRAPDADTGSELESAAVFVTDGDTFQDTAWVMSGNPPITVGTTGLTWEQFAGGGTVNAGAGLTQIGNRLDVVAGDTTLTVATDDVRVNTSVIATVASLAFYTRKFSVACAAATSTVVNHAFNTRNVLVEVARATSPWDTVNTDVERTDLNNVTVRFATAPAASDFIITVAG